MQVQDATLPSTKRKLSLSSDDLSDRASIISTFHQVDPTSKRDRIKEPVSGNRLYILQDPTGNALSMPRNHSKRRSFTPVATFKDAISGDRQGTTTQPLLPSANILELDLARIQRDPSPLAGSSTTISALRPAETPPIHSNGAPRSQCKHHCVRADCPVQSLSSSPSSLFDNLPWISAMGLAPEYDIADLSQIPLSASSVDENNIIRGARPARQRDTSHNRISPPRTASIPSNGPDYTPSTPPPRIPHSRIVFRDLMPLFTYDDHRSPSSPVE